MCPYDQFGFMAVNILAPLKTQNNNTLLTKNLPLKQKQIQIYTIKIQFYFKMNLRRGYTIICIYHI